MIGLWVHDILPGIGNNRSPDNIQLKNFRQKLNTGCNETSQTVS